jgi:lipoyl(octanoyl) transferase
MPSFDIVDLGRLDWAAAWSMQEKFVAQRKQGLVGDTLFYVEHPPVITLGRNAEARNILAGADFLAQAGITVHEANRGGDVTFHGPGQLVGYPIFDLHNWKKDVRAYVQGLEEAIVRALADFGIAAHTRSGKETGVYVTRPDGVPAKICALGVHISRWVTCHGFALNIDTDLRYFNYIVPCGLSLPVTSMRAEGVVASRAEVQAAVTRRLAEIFTFNSPTTEPSPEPKGLELEEMLS